METIKTYLDNMFSALPVTEETMRLKTELLATMEDKYLELKEVGKSENEAIGIVISEFGNIEELTDTLNLRQPSGAAQIQNAPLLSDLEAEEYLLQKRRGAARTAFGVSLCIIGAAILMFCLFFTGSSSLGITIGLVGLLSLVAIAVGIFIYSDQSLQRFEHVGSRNFSLSVGMRARVEALNKDYTTKKNLNTIIGVILCVFSSLFVIIPSIISPDYILLGLAALLIVVSIGAHLLVRSDAIDEGYRILLSGGKDSERNCTEGSKSERIIGGIAGIWWPLTVCIYLLWSFTAKAWNISWVVWPVSGILFGGISTLISATVKDEA